MGTVFNNNVFVYDTIIKALENIDKSETIINNFVFVVSLGDENFSIYEKKILSGSFRLPKSVHLFPSVPQIEVLKRASLFITHAGMNSTSEAIEYGVPIICIPLNADQPMVAKRVCDELKVGINLNPLKLTPELIEQSIRKVLNDSTYKQNMIEISNISKRYTGSISAAKLVMQILNQKNLTN